MKKYVIDASVVVNALSEENPVLRKRCREIINVADENKVKLLAPDSLKQEVANALLSRFKDFQKFESIMANFLNVSIQYVRIDDALLYKALHLASDAHDTVYNATYHAVAISRSATYLTCDKKYFERAKEWGNVELVE